MGYSGKVLSGAFLSHRWHFLGILILELQCTERKLLRHIMGLQVPSSPGHTRIRRTSYYNG
jgi:hypothetical protein